ncbi:MAG: hypothetical protein ACRCV9_16260 [Burkholderiaceae bacterium]
MPAPTDLAKLDAAPITVWPDMPQAQPRTWAKHWLTKCFVASVLLLIGLMALWGPIIIWWSDK